MADKNESKLTFKEKFLSILGKGVTASKKGFKTAGNAISDFGDKSVLRIENSQIRSRIEKKYCQLGEYIYNVLKEKKTAVLTASDSNIKDIMAEIDGLFDQVSANTESIKAVDENRRILNENESSEKTETVKPAARKAAAGKTASASAKASKTTASRTAAKKPAASKTSAAKASAAKTSAAKKPAAKKTAAKPASAKTASKAKKPAASKKTGASGK